MLSFDMDSSAFFFDCIIYGTYLKSIISIVRKPKNQEVSSDFQKFS